MKLHKSSASGVALVIVLGFLVIISALAVAFFSSVTTELKASRNFAAGVTTRQLADSAVQTVMGQIHDASSRKSGCWASQPGMIRVYRDGSDPAPTPSGNADAFFKLYSSNNMVMTKSQLSGFDPSTSDVFAGWAGNPAYWTDLNAPVMVTDATNPSGPKILRYPIIDPSAQGIVSGFSFTGSAVAASATHPLPMPVQWIYVLQDGTLVAPDSGGLTQAGTTAKFTGAVVPTQANPIVGRIAFWTDDESSKLNLNTAAGYMPNNAPAGYDINSYAGSFWDTPRFYSSFDMGQPDAKGMPKSPGGGGLAICQLLQNEFQRYPGHPATTSLSPVFGNMMNSDQLYTMTPRYSFTSQSPSNLVGSGSSEGGTNRVVVGTNIPNPTPDLAQLQPKLDRLYASVDELLFARKNPNADSRSATYTRMTNNSYIGLSAGNPMQLLSPQFLDKVHFFLTTQSRAPELNLFGQPRISIWPVRSQTTGEGQSPANNGLNAFDNTILFCSSVGQSTNTTPPNTQSSPPNGLAPAYSQATIVGAPQLPFRYIFTRREVRSPGGTYKNDQLAASYGTTGADINLYRNSQLIHYLQNMTSNPIPGFGGSFLSKYQTLNRDNILAEIFDYIRCANSIDTITTATGQRNPAQYAPQGIIMPSRVTFDGTNYIHGMGRFPTVSEATLVFYYAGPRWNKTANDPTIATTDFNNPTIEVDATTQYPKVRRYRAFLLLSTFNPMQGYAPTSNPGQNSPKISFIVTGLDKILMTAYGPDGKTADPNLQDRPVFPSANSTPPNPYTSTPNKWGTKLFCASGGAWGGRNYGGYEGFMHTLIGQNVSWAPHKIARGNVVGSETAGPTTTNYLQYPYNSVSAGSAPNAPGATFGNSKGGFQEFYELQSPDPDLYPTAELAVPVAITEATKQMPKQDNSDKYFSISATAGGGVSPAKVQVQITYGGAPLASPAVPGIVVQTLTLNFPATIPSGGSPSAQDLWPLPGGDPGILLNKGDTKINPYPARWETAGYGNASTGFLNGATMNKYYWSDTGSFYPAWHQSGGKAPTNTVLQTHLWSAWSLAARICWSMQNSYNPQTQVNPSATLNYYANRWRNIVQPGDTIRSLVYCNTPKTVGPTNTGDMRLALLQDTPADYYPHPEYFTPYSRACLLRMADGSTYFPPSATPIGFSTPGASSVSMDTGWGNHILLKGSYPGQAGAAKFPSNVAFGNLPYSAKGQKGGVNGVTIASGQQGDFDTGIGSNPDGPFGNKQDEGNVIYAWLDTLTNIWYYPIPYFSGTWQYAAPGNTYTSPCRQMPSPGMFGSLPSQAMTKNANGTTGQGWTTLCFCPNPAAGAANHPGTATTPKDHLLLDLFQMPVVEPYPISEPFSTAGKVNLNYKIAPFGYITRTTALRGVLTPMRVSAVPGTSSSSWSDDYLTYKSGQRDGNGNAINDPTTGIPKPVTGNYRTRVDMDQTIKGFDAFFAKYANNTSDGFFKSASQICEMYLYPVGVTYGQSMDAWWAQRSLTGDNVREKPYVDLYNRVTTKSNTFTVHMRVQTVRQLPRSNGDYTSWNEGKDAVLGEYRGASTIERYIDPADRRFDASNSVTSKKGDLVNPDTQSVEGIYRFRTVISKKFSP